MGVLVIRKLADRSQGTRVVRYDPVTGEKFLFNPETDRAESWPLLGVDFDGEAPEECSVSTGYIANAVNEGWVVGEGQKLVHASGGPPEDEWARTHTFVNYSSLTFKTVSGDVKYEVVGQPGKHEDSEESSGYRFDTVYKLKKVN